MGIKICSRRGKIRRLLLSCMASIIVAGCGEPQSANLSEPGGLNLNDLKAQTPPDWQPLDVSDVAYLWPTMRGQLFNRLTPIVGTQGNDLVPSRNMINDMIRFSLGRSAIQPTSFALFNSQIGRNEFVSTPSDSWRGIRLNDIRIVSFRVENCGDGIGNHDGSQILDKWIPGRGGEAFLSRGVRESCLPMFRLVAQPARGDNALHLIYQYQDPKVIAEMMKDMQFLKKASPVATDGVPLGVHPGLAAEGGVGAFSEQVKFFIVKYARPDKLIKAAFLSTNQAAGGGQWNFFEARILNNSPQNFTWEMNPLLALEGNPISQGFTVPESHPARAGGFAIANLGQSPLPLGLLEASMDPRVTTASNLDCKSCHISTSFAANIASVRPDQFNRFFQRADQVFDIPGITSVPDGRALPLRGNNLRAFGWFERPTVSVRMAKKAGAVAGSMNQAFFGNAAGRGPDCSGQQHLLLKCILSQAGNNSNCIQRFCR